MTVFWLIGATVSEILAPGGSWFTSPEQSGWGWIISLFAILNAYMYGSVLALLFRKPEHWFVFWVPVPILVLTYVTFWLRIDALAVLFQAIFCRSVSC